MPTPAVSQKPNGRNDEGAASMAGLPPGSCPYCSSPQVVKRGMRRKKYGALQLYLCKACRKTFSTQKGKTFPLRLILEGLSLYNLGHTLEACCSSLKERFGLQVDSSTLSLWVKEFEPICRYARLRPHAVKLFGPKQIVESAVLYHRQIYRYRCHRAKLALVLQDYKHSRYEPLRDFLESVPLECPREPTARSPSGRSGPPIPPPISAITPRELSRRARRTILNGIRETARSIPLSLCRSPTFEIRSTTRRLHSSCSGAGGLTILNSWASPPARCSAPTGSSRITSSSVNGVGMKVTRDGVAVGIALEAFDGAGSAATAFADGQEVKIRQILVFVNVGHIRVGASRALEDVTAALRKLEIENKTLKRRMDALDRRGDAGSR